MQHEPQHAVVILAPKIYVRAERVAQVLAISIEDADKMLSQPDLKSILQVGLEQAFQKTVDDLLKHMARIPMESVPSPRVDCAVDLPALPGLKPGFFQ